MSLSIQYSKDSGSTFKPQVGLDVEDYTLDSGVIADRFFSVKDSNDTCYVICWSSTNQTWHKIIKITSSGVITRARFKFSDDSFVSNNVAYFTPHYILSRDELSIFAGAELQSATNNCIIQIFLNFINDVDFTVEKYFTSGAPVISAIYQDRYIWVASGTTVKIYDYTTKAELASVVVSNSHGNMSYPNSICCDVYNNLYIHARFQNCYDYCNKIIFNGLSLNQGIIITEDIQRTAKQMLLDKYGDLIILTNSGTASTLLKYTTAGVQVGATLDLGGAFYNLNTDKDGNYYYSNALGTYKIAANSAQGQAFTGVGSKIRGNGMTSYGSNITGYAPAVFGEQ